MNLEEKKFEFEQKRYENESRFFNKNSGIFISSIVSIALIVVSFTQFKIAETNKQNELSLLSLQFSQQLELEKTKTEREWKIDILGYVTIHSEKIFNGTQTEKEKIMNIILVTFPPEITENLFSKVEATTVDSSKKIWEDGRRKSILLQDIVSIRYYPKADDNIDWAKFKISLDSKYFQLNEYDSKYSISNNEINSVWFGKNVSIETVKKVSINLLNSNGNIKIIRPFRNSETKKNVIEIGTDNQYLNKQILSISEIQEASDFTR